MKKKSRFKISVWQFLALGYLAVIIVGSVLLVLPFATTDGHSASYIDALFTSASATCVTGLAVYDTGTYWSLFGQIVILFLIQTGGLGFMTFVSVIYMLFHKNMRMYERKAFFLAAGTDKRYTGAKQLIKRIFIGTFFIEFIGACLLSIKFIPEYGAGDGIYFSVWHAVSAFCNAGFDLMGKYGGASLSAHAGDPLVTLTLTALIVIGGLGFCVWSDMADCRFNPKKFQLNTQVVLLVTTILIVVSTGLFMLVEWNNTLTSFSFGKKLLVSLFNAVTPRTAGFYMVNPADLSDSGYVLTLILMFIGGNSGSTAGGIKVGTFAVIIMGMIAVFRGRRDINIGKRRIEHSLLSQALAIFASCLMIIMVATLAICAAAPDLGVKAAMFECVSALSTTGLSLNITGTLGIFPKIILIILMYTGRAGILTLALALGHKRTASEVRKPVDNLLIG